MKLSDKRALLTLRIAQLIISSNGMIINGELCRLRGGYWRRNKAGNAAIGGHKKSTHLSSLAVDFALDVSRDGGETWRWVKTSKHPAWVALHDIWDKLGGSKRIKNDMGHFSFKHGGIR